MSEGQKPTETLLDFMMELVSDRRAGEVKDLDVYQARYPEHAAEIARRWDGLGDAPSDADGTDRTIGHYRVEAELGRGGQGTVYRAVDDKLGRTVALKVLSSSAGLDDGARLRFRREAEIASKLDHEGICTVFETGGHQGCDWIAMRYVEGVPLARRIIEHPGLDDGAISRVVDPRGEVVGREALDRLLEFVERTARALHAAHEAGIVHRDVKSGNLMVTEDGAPVIVDFGLARDQAAGVTLTRSGDVFGTPAYMSPEQVRGEHVDRRTDVWSLGVVMYQSLTLELPFPAPTAHAVVAKILNARTPSPRSIEPHVPRDVDAIVRTAMEPSLARRYRTALDLAEDLRRFREHEPILARPAGTILRSVRWTRRHPVAAVLITAAAILAPIGIFGWSKSVESETRRLMLDLLDAPELIREEREELWPVGPELVVRCDDWLSRAAALERRRAGSGRLAEREAAHLGNLDRLAARVPVVMARRERSRTLRTRSIGAPAAAWETCIDAIRSSSEYGGLVLEPQLGLVPLGANAAGLYEFWHVESGARPPYDEARGGHRVDEASGLVLVLVPGGTCELGSRPEEVPASIRQRNEGPVQAVELSAFFLSRYEMTQAQWMRLHEGVNPSQMPPGYDRVVDYSVVDATHPVEGVSGEESRAALDRLALVLPTEAQWEHACRAGTRTIWSFGNRWEIGPNYCNVRAARNEAGDVVGDEWIRHAPVGSFAPNGYGMHDMHGNVFEPCRDAYVDALIKPRPGDGLMGDDPSPRYCALRGGSAQFSIGDARSSGRSKLRTSESFWDLGVRPSRAVDDSRDSRPESDGPRERER